MFAGIMTANCSDYDRCPSGARLNAYVYSRATETDAMQAKVLTEDEARRRRQHCAAAGAVGAQGMTVRVGISVL
jgi:hypothetical protein